MPGGKCLRKPQSAWEAGSGGAVPPGREGLGEDGHRYVYGWAALLFT